MENKKEQIKEVSALPLVKVGISMGDINGISPEVIMKALGDNRMLIDCMPVIYGSTRVLSHYKKVLNDNDFNYQTVKGADDAKPRKINVVNAWTDDVAIDMGKPTETSGKCAFAALELATKDLAAGKIDVLVTAPISKEAMGKMGFSFPGHTEYLADLAGEDDALMLMVSSTMRVGLVTTHIPIKDVSAALTVDRVAAKILALDASLKKDFGILRPKIAVFGLNPHAGENGKMGSEELEVIIPAIGRVRNEGILAFGPFPADGFFGSPGKSEYDGVLAMYHDQGLTAFKALAFDEGVNFTAGLPIIRTSPDHGTAYDIVGQNIASGDSMRNAIYLAIDVHRNHVMEREISQDPLQSRPEEKREKRRNTRENGSKTKFEKN